ncbi:MAG: hypothetical protein AAGF54_20465 [Pseudomonadota bacterium]
MIERIREICGTGPVIPVIEIDDAANAKPLADALLRGKGVSHLRLCLLGLKSGSICRDGRRTAQRHHGPESLRVE